MGDGFPWKLSLAHFTRRLDQQFLNLRKHINNKVKGSMRNKLVLKNSKEMAVMTLENAQHIIAVRAQSVLNWLSKKRKRKKTTFRVNLLCQFVLL